MSLVKTDNAQVINTDFLPALKNFKNESLIFDFIFLDPPYKADFAEQAISQIKTFNLLNEDGLIIWEHDNSKLDFISKNFPNTKTKKYGEKYFTYITFEDINTL